MNNKGQALVEFVIILPIFLLILFSGFDVANILSEKNKLENASIDIIELLKNKEDIINIRKNYKDISIDLDKSKDKTIVTLNKSVEVVTPGLNLVLGKKHKIVVKRIIPNV